MLPMYEAETRDDGYWIGTVTILCWRWKLFPAMQAQTTTPPALAVAALRLDGSLPARGSLHSDGSVVDTV